jgi:hypothetical protein
MALVYISVGFSQQVYTPTSASLPLVYAGGERSRKGSSGWQLYVNMHEARSQGCVAVGIGAGNPGVEKGYPYPNPEIPLPGIPGRGVSGLGWRVPLVPGVLSRAVRNPAMSSRVYHSARERGSSASTPCSACRCCTTRGNLLLHHAR